MTTTRMLAIVAGAGLALVVAVGFLYSVTKDVGPFGGAHHTRTETRVVTDPVRSLVVETDAGSVEVVRGPRLVLRETTSYRGSGAAPHADHELADGELDRQEPGLQRLLHELPRRASRRHRAARVERRRGRHRPGARRARAEAALRCRQRDRRRS